MTFKEALNEALAVVEKINDHTMTMVGSTILTVQAEPYSGEVAVMTGELCIWDSDQDDREQVGACEECGGTGEMRLDGVDGYCGRCGGDGKDDPREPLEAYVRRELRSFAETYASAAGPPMIFNVPPEGGAGAT